MIRAAILVTACDVAVVLALIVSPGITDLTRELITAALVLLLVVLALINTAARRARQQAEDDARERARRIAAVRRRRDRQAAGLLGGIDGHPVLRQDGGEFW